MTDRTPMQRALDRDTEIEELARENERLRDALATIRKGTEMSEWKETDEYTKTLRDEFAMAALPCVARINDWGTFNFKSVSTDAYALADAMLAARKEK